MSSQHQRAKALFLAAFERSPEDRAAFLAQACGDDPALKQEVESLLAFHDLQGGGEGQEVRDAPADLGLVPGTVFAGRYRMITRLGQGGMGDVWRADDLVLGTAVAVKLILEPGPDGRDRILNEVRLARQITHPNVCRVFDVGEADGCVFFTMELVEGEDLAALLKRVGRLPSEKVADIGRQLCAGLSAAHARGVLHRDLKPANVLIDDEGVVRISDFGIAIPRADADQHLHTGTPDYMAPEQRAERADLSERTDVYSLGLVLYELLVGHHALKGRDREGLPPPPSSLVPNVDPRLERVVMQALSPDPDGRPPSAMAVAAALPEPGTRPRAGSGTDRVTPRGTYARRTNWWVVASAVAAGLAVVAVAASFFVTPGARTLTERDTIMLADFENGTGDAVFDGTLKVALAVALEQSPFLQVFPDERARETLRLMERAPDERITREMARDIARRERLKALLAGSIVSLGRTYVIGLEAVNAETGDVMAREQAEAANKEEVIGALGVAASRLREKLGESLASVKRFDVALPRATTQSLEALHAYSLALEEGRQVPRIEAVPHLKRAIEIDPTFAMAHALLSGVYANTGQSALAPEYSRRAFELRDRVSERERFFIGWRYYRDAIQDWEKALDLARSWTATYPREAFAFNALGAALLHLGQFEPSVAPFEKCIQLDPKFTPAYANLAAVYLAVNRIDDARGLLKKAEDQKLRFSGVHRLSYLIAFVQGDTALMARELTASIGVGETNAAFGWQAHASAWAGRAKAAHQEFARGIQMSLQGNFREVAAQLTMEDAENHAVIGQCAEVGREVPPGLELSRDTITLERASRALGLCGDADASTRLTAELLKRFPESTLTVRAMVPIARAALAIARSEPQRALPLLDSIKPYERAPSTEFWPAYLRGLAFLQQKDGAAAKTAFETVVNHHGEAPGAFLFPLANLGLARAAMLTGETDTALRAYQTFFEIWKDADPDLRLLEEARTEASRLR